MGEQKLYKYIPDGLNGKGHFHEHVESLLEKPSEIRPFGEKLVNKERITVGSFIADMFGPWVFVGGACFRIVRKFIAVIFSGTCAFCVF